MPKNAAGFSEPYNRNFLYRIFVHRGSAPSLRNLFFRCVERWYPRTADLCTGLLFVQLWQGYDLSWPCMLPLTPFPATRFHHPCTIANSVLQAQNTRNKGGTIPLWWCLIQLKSLPAGAIQLKGLLVGKPRKRLQGLVRKAHGVWRDCSATTLGARRQERR